MKEYERSRFYDMAAVQAVTMGEKMFNYPKFSSLVKSIEEIRLENGLTQKIYLDDEEKEIYRSAFKKVGRPATGIKRVSINISGQPEQIEQLKELATKENKTVSGFIFEKCGVTMKAKDFFKYDGENVIFEKSIKGSIVKDKQVESSVFGAVGGGLVTNFTNYKIVEK